RGRPRRPPPPRPRVAVGRPGRLGRAPRGRPARGAPRDRADPPALEGGFLPRRRARRGGAGPAPRGGAQGLGRVLGRGRRDAPQGPGWTAALRGTDAAGGRGSVFVPRYSGYRPDPCKNML